MTTNAEWIALGYAPKRFVRVTFDPKVISFKDLLDVFFTIHDPTTLNRQGYDSGTQYRSAIYYHSPEQKATAEQEIAELTALKTWKDRIVTEIKPIAEFYVAEDYHQEYFVNNRSAQYCQVVIEPKVAKARQKFLAQLRR